MGKLTDKLFSLIGLIFHRKSFEEPRILIVMIDPSITVLNYRGLEKTCPSLQPRRAPFKNTQQTIKTAKLDEKNPHFPIPPSPELEENRPDPKQDWFKNKIRTKNWYITFPHTLVNRGHIRTMSIMVGT